jgi:protein-L-isoaspartate(D-aspartate) O-methyltransferase
VNLDEQRMLMVTRQIQARGVRDRRVLDAMARVPRHRFVSESQLASAYGDFPLPIGEGQTISQPYMVATMTESLGLAGEERVLEIGTGSGYQAAVLAELAREVITIERIEALAETARARLAELGYRNVRVIVGDGTLGWPQGAPYQGIMVTAGAPSAPAPLLKQLDVGGRLVVPVGERHTQILEIHTRQEQDKYRVRRETACRFVDLIGKHGWSQHWRPS